MLGSFLYTLYLPRRNPNILLEFLRILSNISLKLANLIKNNCKHIKIDVVDFGT